MKRIIITLGLIIKLTADVFAAGEKIKPEVLDAFNDKFASAQEVTWMAGNNYYKAAFVCNGTWMFAWYNASAEFMGLTRNVSSTQLPLYLQIRLKSKLADYWITSLVEESNGKGFNYYITLENADQKVVLKSAYGNDWEAYHKYNKA